MNLFQYKEEFEFTTSLNSDEIFSTLKEYVEFNYKKKLSTFQIKKEFYGNVLEENYFQVWKKPAISGFVDKGLAPSIEIVIRKNLLA